MHGIVSGLVYHIMAPCKKINKISKKTRQSGGVTV